MVPGVNDSRQTSAHAISRFAIARSCSCLRLSASDHFDELHMPKKCERLGPNTPSLKGPVTRRMSGGLDVSTRTTVAPWSARYLAVSGPTPTHEKSATLRPANGSGVPPSPPLLVWRGAGRVEVGVSRSTSAVGAPTAGEG